MYAALWRRSPVAASRSPCPRLVLFAATVVILFGWVFPAVAPLLPFEDVTVQGVSASPHTVSTQNVRPA